jgi:hypothetical protein
LHDLAADNVTRISADMIDLFTPTMRRIRALISEQLHKCSTKGGRIDVSENQLVELAVSNKRSADLPGWRVLRIEILAETLRPLDEGR